jgi:CBS domain-containing protein
MLQERGQLNLRGVLCRTSVRQLDLIQVPRVSRHDRLETAAAAMRESRQGSALVCEGDRLIGIVTERDLLRAVGGAASLDAEVGQVMTSNPRTISLDDRLWDVVTSMDRGGYRRLPVVDDTDCPAGVIDVTTVVNFLVEQMPATVYNQASRRTLTVQECEGA